MTGIEMHLIGLYFDAVTLESMGIIGASGGSLAFVMASVVVASAGAAIQSHVEKVCKSGVNLLETVRVILT